MKVLYDARWLLVEDRFDGVSRYSHELAWAMSRQPDITLTWLVRDPLQLAKLPPGEHVLANDPQDAKKELSLPKQLNPLGFDVVYSPFFVMGTSGKSYPLVLTIHDMIYFHHRTPPQWLPWQTRLGWWLFHLTYVPMRWQLNRADAVATVSETARHELLAAHASKRPVTTVQNAVSHAVAPPDQSQILRYVSKDILYMGAFTPYKNVECLIDALPHVPDVTLHLLSKMPPKRRKVLEKRMKSLGVESRIVIHDGVTDGQYIQLLASCRGLITASKIEGFGLPILEAQQQGVPVACSDIPIFREVAGESAKFFDPNDPVQCAAAMRYLGDAYNSSKLIEHGYANAARYTWDASARVAVELCRQIMKK